MEVGLWERICYSTYAIGVGGADKKDHWCP